tara:strand:+ start:2938 stop:3261 length:324 start_codon:yes stop_codon:yes gene_type:complete
VLRGFGLSGKISIYIESKSGLEKPFSKLILLNISLYSRFMNTVTLPFADKSSHFPDKDDNLGTLFLSMSLPATLKHCFGTILRDGHIYISANNRESNKINRIGRKKS